MTIKKRIKRTLIPEIVEQLDIWEDEGEITKEQASYLRNELNGYLNDDRKQFLNLGIEDDKILKAAIEAHTYWNY